MNKAEARWVGTIRNISGRSLPHVEFCVKAFDAVGLQFAPNKSWDGCVVRLSAVNWEDGTSRYFEGQTTLKFDHEKTPVRVSKYEINATESAESSNVPPNLRTLNVPCSAVWTSLLRVIASLKLQPTLMQRDSYTVTFVGLDISGMKSANRFLSAYTNYQGLGPLWVSSRVESGTAFLREEEPGSCTAEVTMTFSAIGNALGQVSKYSFVSNLMFESSILAQIEAESKKATVSSSNMSPAPADDSVGRNTLEEKAQLIITSEPSGAEIEINGEFIGNTPSTLTTKVGPNSLVIRKPGFPTWQHTLNLKAGDKRTVHADMGK